MQEQRGVARARARGRAWWRRRRSDWEKRRPFRHPVPWLVLVVVVLLAYAWGPMVSGWYWSLRYDLPEMGERSETHFHALAYDGSVWTADREGRRRFAEHLRSLRDAGFVPVGMDAVQALYREGRLMPPRAVLITVDGVPAENWRPWRNAVIRERFRAVAFVDPERPRRPFWSSLRRAQLLPHWDIGVQLADLPLAARGDETERLDDGVEFDAAVRYQRLHRMRDAAIAQHQSARAEAIRHLAATPSAAAYPRYVAQAEYRMANEVRRHILADTAGAFYPTAFSRGGLSVNAAQADPMRLNRLSVPPEWDGARLVRRLRTEAAMDFRMGAVHDRTRVASWIPVLGKPDLGEEGLRLSAPPGEAGDGVWLAGSDMDGDFALRLGVEHESGIFRVLFMASPDELYRWELRLDDTGAAQIRRRQGTHETVVREGRFAPRNEPRLVELRVRGSQLWVTLDGEKLFDGWVSLRDQLEPGRIGLRVQGGEGRSARVQVREAVAGVPEKQIALWDASSALDPRALAWTADHAGEIGAISPPLARLTEGSAGIGLVTDEELYRTLSRLNRWSLLPHIHIAGARDLSRWTPDAIHAALAPLDVDGLLVRLDARENWSLQDLSSWVRRTAALLETQGRRFYLGLPDIISSRLSSLPPLAAIPGVHVAVGPEAVALVREGAAVERRIPVSEMEQDLQQYYELVADRAHRPRVGTREEVRRWRDEAEAHYGVGEYEDAVTLWFDWHELDPEHAFPLRRIGDALYRMGYRDEAADFYQQSLERDPANIGLAVQVVQLLDAEGAQEEARLLLQTYALLFPEDPAVLLAQAEWLFRRGRLEESHARVRQVLAVEPDHLPATLLMAHLARTPDDRREAIHRLQQLGRDETAQLRVLQTIRDADLMTLPEAEPLVDMVRRLSERELEDEAARMVRTMLPRSEPVRQNFTDGEMGPEWMVDGASVHVQPNRLRVRADPGREEVLLRLTGSDRWRNAFVEVEVDDVHGDFWIMLRRSRNNLIRYGFDESLGQMLLQIWEREGEQLILKEYRVESWTRPSGTVRLRLEARGEGIVTKVQGRVWSTPPLPLPSGLTPGWVAAGIHSAEPGRAEMVLRSVAAGPIFPSLARLDDVAGDRLEEQAARLRSMLNGLTALSPSWFSVGPDGAWSSRAGQADEFYRMFARYHGLSLLPEVRVAPGARPGASTLADAARVHNVRGFLLVLEQAPSAAWLRDLNTELSERRLDVLLAHPVADSGDWRLMGLGEARLLFPGAPEGITVQSIPVQESDTLPAAREKGPAWIRF